MFSLLVIAVLAPSVAGLIGYDCGSPLLNVTTISLLDVGACNIPQHKLNITHPYVQLLQVNDFLETGVVQCKLEVHRTIYYCGLHSHNSIVDEGVRDYVQEINREQCRDLYKTGTLYLGGGDVVRGIRINQTMTFPMTFAGFLSRDGTCNGAAYIDPYGKWQSVVVQGTVKVTVTEQLARVDTDNDRIHLRSGTICRLSDTTCIDIEGGYTFWNPVPVDSCKFNRYSILYEGYATKMVDYTKYTNHDQTVYSLVSEEITFALTKKGEERVCGYTIMRTEHPKLVIFETLKGRTFANYKVSVNNLDLFAYVNSKFIYVERHIRTQINHLYQDVLRQSCNLERETLKNALAIATQAPDQFAYNLMKGPGYMAVTAGEVIHVIKCVPVEVKVEHKEQCYAELPVTRNNQTYFLTPRTHILKEHGTRIDCNPLLPSHYFLGEEWYKITPRPIETKPPVEISPNTKATWHYVSPASLANSGIYSEKDLHHLRDHIMFPVERSALLNDVAREMKGHTIADNTGTISKLLNKDAADVIFKSTWSKLWEKFITFGTISAGVLTVFMIYGTVKSLVEMLINGYLLHQVYGWSIHLLAAVWNSVAYLLVYLRPANPENAHQPELHEVHHYQSAESDPTPIEDEPSPPEAKPREKSSTQTNVKSSDPQNKFFSL